MKSCRKLLCWSDTRSCFACTCTSPNSALVSYLCLCRWQCRWRGKSLLRLSLLARTVSQLAFPLFSYSLLQCFALSSLWSRRNHKFLCTASEHKLEATSPWWATQSFASKMALQAYFWDSFLRQARQSLYRLSSLLLLISALCSQPVLAHYRLSSGYLPH